MAAGGGDEEEERVAETDLGERVFEGEVSACGVERAEPDAEPDEEERAPEGVGGGGELGLFGAAAVETEGHGGADEEGEGRLDEVVERATGPWDVFRVEGDEIGEFWPAGVFEIGGDAPPLDDFRHHEEHDGTAPCVEGCETRREDVGFVDWFHGGSYAVGESDARESVAVIGGHAGEFLAERGAVDA